MTHYQRWRGGRGGGGGKRLGAPTSSNKPCANPIFESWLLEWKEDAESKDSKMKYVYGRALKSLRKYPLPLASGKDCSILENFGAHMCKMIENRMVKENMITPETSQSVGGTEEEEEEESEPLPGTKKKKGKRVAATATVTRPTKPRNTNQKKQPVEDLEENSEESLPSTSSTSTKPKKKYLPAYRSGAYAILLALLEKESEPSYRGYMTKSELQIAAQKYCDASMTKPDSNKNSHYTAWNSMKPLINKELIIRQGGNPVQFFLTDEGRSLAQKLLDANSQPPQVEEGLGGGGIESQDVSGSETTSLSEEDAGEAVASTSSTPSGGSVRLEPGKFEIVLYVDTCETSGRSKSQDVINELQKNGVTVYVHRLSVGDFVWVCREVADVTKGLQKRFTISRTNELVLPYVVERKRIDDLAHSIRDGRFHEQKFRLTQTKLQPIYLIESYGKKGDNWGLAEGALDRAICNTQIENGFLVQESSSIKETCSYLTIMTRHLKTMYERKTIIGCRKEEWQNFKDVGTCGEPHLMFFSDFNDFAVKKMNWKAKEMFARHLMRLKGLSVDKAYAIIQKYPTVGHLLEEYSECEDDKQKERLIATIDFGTGGRKIGPSISRKISRLYNITNLS